MTIKYYSHTYLWMLFLFTMWVIALKRQFVIRSYSHYIYFHSAVKCNEVNKQAVSKAQFSKTCNTRNATGFLKNFTKNFVVHVVVYASTPTTAFHTAFVRNAFMNDHQLHNYNIMQRYVKQSQSGLTCFALRVVKTGLNFVRRPLCWCNSSWAHCTAAPKVRGLPQRDVPRTTVMNMQQWQAGLLLLT